MRQLLNSKVIQFLSILLIIIAIAKFINIVLLYNLPKSGVEISQKNTNLVDYKSYKIATAFGLIERKKEIKKPPPKETLKINNLILLALYGENLNSNEKTGFIVFTESKAPNNAIVLGMGKEHKGYKLTHIKKQSAILQKEGKAYELNFKESPNSVPIQKRISKPSIPQSNTDTNVVRAVKRKDVMYYAKNFDTIWKNIAIKEVVKEGKINGFKVLSVKKNSIFSQLGLTKGDVIVAVNNKPLRSYADAFNIYNNIKDYESLKIDIIRNNEKKELEYEIF